MCKACAQDTLHCVGCTASLPRSFFDKVMWQHGRQGQTSICTRCEVVGLLPRDVQRDSCDQCGEEYGHMKFDKSDLKNLERTHRTTKLCCQLCKSKSTRSSAAAKVRQATLLSIRRQSDAWRCTCKQIPLGQRADHALNHQVHSERCALQPTSLGEPRRWDGKNKGITLDDLRFKFDRKAY